MRGDIKIYRKDDADAISVTITDAGAPVDITGWTFYFTAKTTCNIADDKATISKTITVHTDPTHGKTAIALSKTDTAVPAGNYVYDLISKNGAGKVQTINQGQLTIIQRVRESV
jgi:hypothetical protein